MNEKSKKTLSFCLGCLIVLGGAQAVYEYNNDIEFEREVNSFITSKFFDKTYSIPNGKKYSDFNTLKETYYVYKNDKRVILSTNPNLDGYECLGIYDSKNSADAVFYYAVVSSADMVAYDVVSYDDLEGRKSPLNIIDDVTLIDENSPEEVSAYIPEPSIRPIDDYSKVIG